MEKKRVQRYPRFTKRLEATFSSGGFHYRGILRNVSEGGLFIRTNHGFSPGTVVDIEIMLPDNQTSRLKGIVVRTIKTPMVMNNGIGIDLTVKDETFLNFVKTMGNKHVQPETSPETQFTLLSCPHCKVKNRVPEEKVSGNPKCGKCGNPLLPV